jgi:hypothetical protein
LPDGEVRLFVIFVDKAEFGSAIMRVPFAPTVGELMRLCGKSRATIYRRLEHLDRHGWAVKPTNVDCGRKVVRVLQVGERCECLPHGGNRRKPPTPTAVSSWKPEESHLGTEISLILKPVSAAQITDPDYGASMGEGLRGDNERGRLIDRPSESWRSWPEGTIGYEQNRDR